MNRLTYGFFLAFCLIASNAAHALDVLGVKDNVDNAAKKAQETGDAIALAFAQQALRIIAEFEKSSKELVHTALEELDASSNKIFTDINNVATRIEQGEAIAFVDIQRTMANAGSQLAQVPFASKEPMVTFYWPAILVPGGEKTVTVRIIGTRIAKANPRIEGVNTPIEVKRPGDNEITFAVDRSTLAIAPTETKATNFKLTYEIDRSVWYNPLSWGTATEQRDIELRMLPSAPGTVRVDQVVNTETWKPLTVGPIHVGARGKNAPYQVGSHLTPQQQQEGWQVDFEEQAKAPFDDNRGDGNGGSSCTGYNPGGFTNNFVAFTIQHGSTNGGRSDAYQNCNIYMKLKRKIIEKVALAPMEKSLNWLQDTDFSLDPNMDSYNLIMKLYTGQAFTIKSPKDIPYSLFVVSQDKSSIKIRPRAPREF